MKKSLGAPHFDLNLYIKQNAKISATKRALMFQYFTFVALPSLNPFFPKSIVLIFLEESFLSYSLLISATKSCTEGFE